MYYKVSFDSSIEDFVITKGTKRLSSSCVQRLIKRMYMRFDSKRYKNVESSIVLVFDFYSWLLRRLNIDVCSPVLNHVSSIDFDIEGHVILVFQNAYLTLK